MHRSAPRDPRMIVFDLVTADQARDRRPELREAVVRRRFPRAARAFLGFRVTSGCAVHTVELRAQFSEFTASPSALIMVDDALKMKLILPTLTVLALLMGISGCFDPVRERRDSPDDRTADRYAEGGRNHWVLVSPMLHEPHV